MVAEAVPEQRSVNRQQVHHLILPPAVSSSAAVVS
jgi:hypothetical protein